MTGKCCFCGQPVADESWQQTERGREPAHRKCQENAVIDALVRRAAAGQVES